MKLVFTKMQALANDFIVIADLEYKLQLTTKQIQALCARKTGVGCDQLLLILPARSAIASSTSQQEDFYLKIFNSDGSEAYQCGNGMRCVGRYLVEKNLIAKNKFTVATAANVFEIEVAKLHSVSVNMRAPIFLPEKIPFLPVSEKITDFSYVLPISEGDIKGGNINRESINNLKVTPLSMGNPHGVIFVDESEFLKEQDFDTFDITAIGHALSCHPQFPERANIEFVKWMTLEHLKVRIFERGAGETAACGSGACAAMAAARVQQRVAPAVNVEMPGGTLQILWQGPSTDLMMTGEAHHVFEGEQS